MASKRKFPVDDSPSTSCQPEKKVRGSDKSDQYYDGFAELPILRLNHDCLLKIMQYLSFKDLLNFSLLNSHIADVLEENACRLVGSEILLDNHFRRVYPRAIYSRLFQMISPGVQSAKIHTRNQQYFRDFMKDFTHLKEVHFLANMELRSAATVLPPMVKLNLVQGTGNATVVKQLFTRMSPTLRKLYVGGDVAHTLSCHPTAIDTLQHLESIQIPDFMVEGFSSIRMLEKMLRQNPKLTKLSIRCDTGYYPNISMAEIVNVKKLKIIGRDWDLKPNWLMSVRVPLIEKLVIKDNWTYTCIAPLKDIGPQLKIIKIGKDVINVDQDGFTLCPKYCQACQNRNHRERVWQLWGDYSTESDSDDDMYFSDSIADSFSSDSPDTTDDSSSPDTTDDTSSSDTTNDTSSSDFSDVSDEAADEYAPDHPINPPPWILHPYNPRPFWPFSDEEEDDDEYYDDFD